VTHIQVASFYKRTWPPLLLTVSSRQRTLVEEVRTTPFYLFRYGMRGFAAVLRGARYELRQRECASDREKQAKRDLSTQERRVNAFLLKKRFY